MIVFIAYGICFYYFFFGYALQGLLYVWWFEYCWFILLALMFVV